MRRLALVALLLPTAWLHAQHGFDPARLERLTAYMQLQVDSQRIAGAVALVMRDGQVVYERAVGWSDREAKRPMTTDAIFRIASQTKAITSAAILQLVEEGKIGLRDPVSKWIPSFARDTGRQIVIFDLLTHTAGISYGLERRIADRYAAVGLGPAAGLGWYFADKAEPICTTMDRLGALPTAAQPGERWIYGYSTDVLGCVVERASGLSLDAYFKARITGPLKMTDTDFFVPRAKAQRLTAVYQRKDGRITRADTGARGQGHYVDGPRMSFSGGAGLTSTIRDYARFLEAIRRGGTLDGARILSPASTKLMTTDQVGGLYTMAGEGWGLAFATTDSLGAKGFPTPGSFNWGGAYSSIYYVDPAEGLVMILLMQVLPMDTDLRAKFSSFVYGALSESRASDTMRPPPPAPPAH